MKNELITLITTVSERNERGFEVTKDIKSKEIFAGIRSAGVIEKYEAQRAGINVSIIFIVDANSYIDAIAERKRPDKVEFNGELYTIYDVRNKGTYSKLEIVCKR